MRERENGGDSLIKLTQRRASVAGRRLFFFLSIVLRGFLDDWSSSMLSILATRDAARGLDEKCVIKEEGVVSPPCYCLLGTLLDPLIAC